MLFFSITQFLNKNKFKNKNDLMHMTGIRKFGLKNKNAVNISGQFTRENL